MLAAPGEAALALGGEQAQRDGLAADHVPERHGVVDRPGNALRSGHHGDAAGRVHRVIDRRRPVRAAIEAEHDHVRTARGQRLESEFALERQVGHENAVALARRADQRGGAFAILLPAQIQGDGALAPVEEAPVEARPRRRMRITPVIEPALRRIEADHLGAELRKAHGGERGGNEGGRFDDPQPAERPLPCCVPRICRCLRPGIRPTRHDPHLSCRFAAPAAAACRRQR